MSRFTILMIMIVVSAWVSHAATSPYQPPKTPSTLAAQPPHVGAHKGSPVVVKSPAPAPLMTTPSPAPAPVAASDGYALRIALCVICIGLASSLVVMI
ncbi:hypothetical protein LIER_11055 [Lithospermum erythrorhizon]|uniref:Transmembrane protein n=1 Tax=Lithospermum erythrorhizon TaxID=34254 RepID=A0AAV3PND9_LITER